MAQIFGRQIPGTARAAVPRSGDEDLDRLMDSMHSDGKNRERMERARPMMDIITNPELSTQYICTEHFKADNCPAQKLPFEDIEKEMDAMNRMLMECAIPFMRGGTDNKALKAPLEWIKKVADFKASVTNTKKELTNYHSGDIYELARSWAERVGSWKTNDIYPGWAIWIKSWKDQDLSPAYNVWINQISPMQPFSNSPPSKEASIDLSGSAQKQREARQQFAKQSQTSAPS